MYMHNAYRLGKDQVFEVNYSKVLYMCMCMRRLICTCEYTGWEEGKRCQVLVVNYNKSLCVWT